LNYSALRELEKHPDPVREFELDPDMTPKKARHIMRRLHKKEKGDLGGRRKDMAKLLADIAAVVRSAARLELKFVNDAAHLRLMKEMAAKHKLSPTALRAGGDDLRDALHRSADVVEQLADLIAAAEADKREHAALEPARQRLAQQRALAAQALKPSTDNADDADVDATATAA
jgi:hypothetical protein